MILSPFQINVIVNVQIIFILLDLINIIALKIAMLMDIVKLLKTKKNVLMNAKMIMNISMNMITYAIKIVQKIKKLM